MAVIEVDLISGFTADIQSLEEVRFTLTFKTKKEFLVGREMLVILVKNV